MQTLHEHLEALGLGSYEAKVYGVLLRHSPSSAAFIAKKAQLSRSTVYTVLHGLAGKGLVATTYKNGVKQFVGEEVAALERMLQRQRLEADEKLRQFPALEALVRTFAKPDAHIPQVMLFEGQEGLKKAYLSLLRDAAPGSVLCLLRDEFVWRPEWRFVFEPEWHDRNKRFKAEKGIVTRLLTNDSAAERAKRAFYASRKGLEQRFLPAGSGFDRFAFYVLGDTAILLSFEEGNLVGVKIVNVSLAANLHRIFGLLWAACPAGAGM